MKYYISIFCVAVFVMTTVKAQQCNVLKLTAPEKSLGGFNVYMAGFTNNGDAKYADFGSKLEEAFKTFSYIHHIKQGPVWRDDLLYKFVDSKDEADVVVEGSYKITPSEIRDIKEKLVSEPSSIPFGIKYTVCEYNFTNGVYFTADIKISDKSGAEISNFQLSDSVVSQHSKDVVIPKIKPLAEIEPKFIDGLMYYIPVKYRIVGEEVWVKFFKMSPKDKAQKEEYKNFSDYVKNDNFTAAGKLCKAIYDSTKDPLAAFNTALCYEVLGNYAKAAEYYKIKFDFPAKKRMEQNMKIWEILPEISKNKLVEF